MREPRGVHVVCFISLLISIAAKREGAKAPDRCPPSEAPAPMRQPIKKKAPLGATALPEGLQPRGGTERGRNVGERGSGERNGSEGRQTGGAATPTEPERKRGEPRHVGRRLGRAAHPTNRPKRKRRAKRPRTTIAPERSCGDHREPRRRARMRPTDYLGIILGALCIVPIVHLKQ